MSNLIVGLIMIFLIYGLFLVASFAIVMLIPQSWLGTSAKAVLQWVPPFMGGEALRRWAETTAERVTRESLTGERTAQTGARLASTLEEGAMQAMLPTAQAADLGRVVPCPETGQGRVGVTAPEALAIAEFLRKHRTTSEQQRIYDLAVENARKLATHARSNIQSATEISPLPCPLHGAEHVCCAYGSHPLHCRPLHAIAIAKDLAAQQGASSSAAGGGQVQASHEQNVTQGIEAGLAKALKEAGVDAEVYELNSALVTALGTPNAAERWAKGEKVFHSPLT